MGLSLLSIFCLRERNSAGVALSSVATAGNSASRSCHRPSDCACGIKVLAFRDRGFYLGGTSLLPQQLRLRGACSGIPGCTTKSQPTEALRGAWALRWV